MKSNLKIILDAEVASNSFKLTKKVKFLNRDKLL